MIPDSFPHAYWRSLSGPDKAGRIGISFDAVDGSIIRFGLTVREAWTIYEVLGGALLRGRGGPLRHRNQSGTEQTFHSAIADDSPKVDVSTPSGQ